VASAESSAKMAAVMVAIVAMLTGFGSYMVSGNTNASCTE
jgi:hypothetical protein